MPINKNKYHSAILYLCQKLGGEIRGKKKLAKLLYFADFDFYEKYQKSITGDTYHALPMGPFPSSLDDMTAMMTKKKEISIEQVKGGEGLNPTEVYRCVGELHDKNLNDDERNMLDRIAMKYGNLNGKQLQDLSHAEAPYIGTQLKKEIPYELAFYRGTDFSDL